jgi:WD40 repeat protein
MIARVMTAAASAIALALSVMPVHGQAIECTSSIKSGTDAFGDPLPPGAIARFGSLRWRPGEPCARIAFSADGKNLVTVGAINGVCVWDVATGKKLRSFGQRAEPFHWAAISRDGRYVARSSSNYDGTDQRFWMWEVATGKTLWEIREKNAPAAKQAKRQRLAYFDAVDFSPDGNVLATRGQGLDVHLWDVKSGKRLARLDGPSLMPAQEVAYQTQDYYWPPAVRALAFSSDGKRLVLAGEDGRYCLWDTETGITLPRQTQGNGPIRFLKASPIGDRLAWFEGDSLIEGTWDGQRRQLEQREERHRFASPLAFSRDGQFLARQRGEVLLVWDLVKRNPPRQLQIPSNHWSVNALAFSPDGTTLAIATDVLLCIWELKTGTLLTERADVSEITWSAALSPAADTLVTTNMDDLKLWDARTGQLRRIVETEGNCEVYLSPGGYWMVEPGEDYRVGIRDACTGKELRAIELSPLRHELVGDMIARLGMQSPVGVLDALVAAAEKTEPLRKRVLGLSIDGKRLVTRSTEELEHWELNSGNRVGRWKHDSRESESIDISSGGTRVAGAESDLATGKVTLYIRGLGKDKVWWQVPAPQREWWQSLFTALEPCFAPNGKMLALFLDVQTDYRDFRPRLQLLETHSGKLRRELTLPRGVHRWCLSADGRTMAVASNLGNLSFWDLVTGEQTGQIASSHDTGLTNLSFSSDGWRLLTIGRDATVLLWDVGAVTQRVQKVPAKPLSLAELEKLWLALGDQQADKAFTAIWSLVATPQQTLALFKEKLKPWRVNPELVKQWIADLDSDRFADRARATSALATLGEMVVPSLQSALVPGLRLEKRRRLEALLTKLDHEPLTLEQLRDLRAVEVLELIGTPETRPLLEAVAKGDPETRLTQDARIALQRLKS